MPDPDLRHIEADSDRYVLPENGRLGGDGIASARQRKFPNGVTAPEQFVEVPFHGLEIEHEVQSVPTSEGR